MANYCATVIPIGMSRELTEIGPMTQCESDAALVPRRAVDGASQSLHTAERECAVASIEHLRGCIFTQLQAS